MTPIRRLKIAISVCPARNWHTVFPNANHDQISKNRNHLFVHWRKQSNPVWKALRSVVFFRSKSNKNDAFFFFQCGFLLLHHLLLPKYPEIHLFSFVWKLFVHPSSFLFFLSSSAILGIALGWLSRAISNVEIF